MRTMRFSVVVLLGLSCMASVGCGSSAPDVPGAAVAPAAAGGGAASPAQAPASPQTELQEFLLEWLKSQNPQIAADEAQKRVQDEYAAYLQSVATDCPWSPLLPPDKRAGSLPENINDLRTFAEPKNLPELRKSRAEFELGPAWVDALLKAAIDNVAMTPERQELLKLVCEVEAGRLIKKLS